MRLVVKGRNMQVTWKRNSGTDLIMKKCFETPVKKKLINDRTSIDLSVLAKAYMINFVDIS
jgi:hypothetical protein